jgi:hypothetical protein
MKIIEKMVLKRLPTKIVKRLRTAYQKHAQRKKAPYSSISNDLKRFFSRLPSADHRNPTSHHHRIFTAEYSYRVRELRVKGTNGVVIKRVHDDDPLTILKTLRTIVDLHNKTHNDSSYILKKPVGHPIGEHFIAMSKVNAPSIGEMLPGKYETNRGKEFLKKLARETGLTTTVVEERLEKAHESLFKNCETAKKQVYIPQGKYEFLRTNVLVVGFEKGKFVFVPLIDTH